MISITVPEREFWDETKREFINTREQKLQLEHSLVSISKWESKHHKSFLDSEKSVDEIIDYVKCMTLTQNVNPLVYQCLTKENIKEISDYIEDPMTATTFREDKAPGGKKEIITSELIYHWMIALQIPVEFQKWHLNRLLTLIRVCNIKNQPQKKRSKREIIDSYEAMNEANRKRFNSKG